MAQKPKNPGPNPAPADAEAPGAESPAESRAASGEPGTQALKLLEEENRRLLDQLLRLKADFENFRKRVDREKSELIRLGREDLLHKLIPLHDTLRAAHGQIAGHDASLPTAELTRGLELIFKEFAKLFESEGVVSIETVGKPYDFHIHDALGQVETDEFPEGTVVEEIQRGYLLGGRILRTAKVRVAKKRQGGLEPL